MKISPRIFIKKTTLMKHTRIVKLYNIMETGEKTRLKAMLTNEKHGSEVLMLHNHLAKYANKKKKLDKEQVFKAVFGINHKFDEPKLSQLRFKLFKLAENFVLINWLSRKVKNNTDQLVQKQLLQLEYYKNKILPANSVHTEDLSELVKFKLSDIDKTLKKAEAKNIDYYFYLHKLNHHLYYSLNSNIWREGGKYLKVLLNNLDIYYCLAKMRYYCEGINRKNSTTEKLELPHIKTLLNLSGDLRQSNYNEIALLELYEMFLRLSEELTINNITKVVNKTIKNEHQLDKRELGFIITFLLNYTIQLKRRDGENINKLNYKIYKLGLKRTVFELDGLLHPIHLINYVYLCSKLGNIEEIDFVWKNNEYRVENDFKEPTYNLCMAFKKFEMNEFEEAINCTKKETKQVPWLYFYRKILQIKSLYELKIYNEIEEERSNLLKYLKNNETTFSEFERKSYYNFSIIIKSLINPNIETSKLYTKCEDKNYVVVEREWLIKKIKEK